MGPKLALNQTVVIDGTTAQPGRLMTLGLPGWAVRVTVTPEAMVTVRGPALGAWKRIELKNSGYRPVDEFRIKWETIE
jgi:hypothetical protein